MKKIFRKFTLLLLLVPMLNSCELDPIDYSDINPSIFPQSKEDLEAMVLSCYYPLRGSWLFRLSGVWWFTVDWCGSIRSWHREV